MSSMSMISTISLRPLLQASDLIWAWTARTIRGRYQQSLLGWLWAVVQPAATVTVFTIVFTRFVPIDTGTIPYPVFSYTAMVPWTFLAASLSDMAASLVQNMNLVMKIYFPREALPIAAMLARALDFLVASALLVLLLIYFQVPVAPLVLLLLPLVFAIQVALIVGIGLIAAALNVFYRDVQPMLVLVLQLWFYASPIIYPVSRVPEGLRNYYFFNPMAGILESYRDILLRGTLPGTYLLYSAVLSLAICALGYVFFKRVEHLFADIV